jgi:hypothetical protein
MKKINTNIILSSMKEGKIFRVTIEPNTETAARLYQSFFTEKVLRPEHIRTMAKTLADVIRSKLPKRSPSATAHEWATVVFDVLRPEHIFEENRVFLEQRGYRVALILSGDDGKLLGIRLEYTDAAQQFHSDVIAVTEFESVLLHIREAVWAALVPLLDDAVVHLVERNLKKDGRVQKLFGDRVLKLVWEDEDDDDRQHRLRGLKDLYALPERSPYLSYQHVVVDPSNNVIELQYTMNFLTLDAVMNMPSIRFPFQHVVSYFLDAVRGALFLVDHGFVLTDLASKNIAVVATEGDRYQGMLFDYDGLHHADDLCRGYATRDGYYPPEVDSGPPFARITEANMVYEFGVELGNIIVWCAGDSLAPPELRALAKEMTDEHPHDRPLLRDVI